MGKLRSPALFALVELIKTPMDQEWKKQLPRGDGEKFIQQMRVQFTRLKEQAEKQNKTIRPFKIRCVSINQVDDATGKPVDEIVLMRTQSGPQAARELLIETLGEDFTFMFGGGEKKDGQVIG